MERALESLSREAEAISEEDPGGVARLMRRAYEVAGLPLTDGVREAIARMEAGEDPERIEEELGAALDEEELLTTTSGAGLRALRRRLKAPEVDDELYEL
jgi:hypothetical protein